MVMRIVKKFTLLLFCFLLGCNSIKKPAVIENNQEVYYGKKEKFKFLKIIKNQSINEIAKEYKIPVKEIKRLNSLNSYDNIHIGQIIKLPIGNYYLIKQNDNLENIARAHDIDLETLANINDLNTNANLYPGDYIKIPETESVFTEKENHKHINFDSSEIYNSDQEENIRGNNEEQSKLKASISNPRFFKNDYPINSKDFIWPLKGTVVKGYGLHNEGINIAAKKGTPIKAAARGEVLYIGSQEGYGKLIILKHNNGYMTGYSRIEKILVKKGQIIDKGAYIGTVGDLGKKEQVQLHFSMKKGNHIINPDG